MQKYSKALVPAVVAVVLGVFSAMGITEDMTVKDVVSFVATSGLVWLVPNKG